MDISSLTNGLEKKDGIWVSLQTEKEISYTESKNTLFSKIESKSYWFSNRNKVITTLSHRFFEKKEIVDIGGGNGIVSKALADEGFDTCIIEPHLNGIIRAKEKGLTNLINATFEELELTDNSIPNAGLFDVVEHIKDDYSFLNSLHKALCEGGKVIITVPAYSFLWSKTDIDAGHFRRYTLKTIAKVLTETGFTVVYTTHLFSFLVPAIFIFKAVPFMFFKQKSVSDLSREKEHIPQSGILSWLINLFCSYEVQKISKGRKVHWGSSCIIVAGK